LSGLIEAFTTTTTSSAPSGRGVARSARHRHRRAGVVFCIYWFVLRKRKAVSEFPYLPLETKAGAWPWDFDRSTSITGSKLTKVVRVNSSRNAGSSSAPTTSSSRRTEKGRRSRELLAEVTNFLEVHYPNITIELRDDDHPWSPPLDSCKKTSACSFAPTRAVAAACVCFPSRWNLASKLVRR